MEPALLAGLSALTVSLLGGATQLWQLVVKTRLDRRHASEAQAIQLQVDEEKTHQKAVSSLCEAIQAFQDEILLIIRATDHDLPTAAERTRLVNARDLVLQAFQKHHPNLAHHERVAGLAARERCVDVVFMLSIENAWTGGSLQITLPQRQLLHRASLELSHAHQLLLSGAVNRLAMISLPPSKARLNK